MVARFGTAHLRAGFRPPAVGFGLALVGTFCCNGSRLEVNPDEHECEFALQVNDISPKVPTVGIVEWSLGDVEPTSAKVVYELRSAPPSVLNRRGEAPVDVHKPTYRTLLLGLKAEQDYTFHIEATFAQYTCTSPTYTLPTTGKYETLPAIAVTVAQPDEREPGFIVTSAGTSRPSSVFIIDADGDIVWYFDAPGSTTRALMDYEGENMWMLALNLLNSGGEMRYVSMDGMVEQLNVPGLATAHHDFTVMPGGRVAALAWSEPGIDPSSELLVRSPDGLVTSLFEIGSNFLRSESFHANAVHYIERDGSFTISDLNPNAIVKVNAKGILQWQLGGSCDAAPAGSRCSAGNWEQNHGHHLLDDGTFVLFNNTNTQTAHVLEFALADTSNAFVATLRKDYVGTAFSANLGDAQRLPGGNTLVTYSAEGNIVELDSAWQEVQTFLVRVGYTSFRTSLYGAPRRP
jgi:hypothetical protein